MINRKAGNPHRKRFTLPWLIPAIVVPAGMLFTLGCNREKDNRTNKVEIAPAAQPAGGTPGGMPMGAPLGGPTGMPEGAMPDGHLPKPPGPMAKNALKWTLPKGWTRTAGRGMRFATLTPPGQGKAEISVVMLPGAAGTELANVNRWRGQIALQPLDLRALGTARQTVQCKAGTVAVYDFTGEGGLRMVTGILATHDGDTWFLKLMGDTDRVSKAKPAFMKYLGTLYL
jgi:hypothetical protein